MTSTDADIDGARQRQNTDKSGLGPLDWVALLDAIHAGSCTPFLGAGAAAGCLPVASDLAAEWAKKYNYPLGDPTDLLRVAQFLAVKGNPAWAKQLLRDRFRGCRAPDFSDPHDLHGLLASYPFSCYFTTNYDDFMVQAVRNARRTPERDFCRWNKFLREPSMKRKYPSVFVQKSGYVPSVDRPVVFHLHGILDEPDSLVVTEDDYLDFMMSVSTHRTLIPESLHGRFSKTLLFLGYRLADWNFRVLFKMLTGFIESSSENVHISVQLVPLDGLSDKQNEEAMQYLTEYFRRWRVRVYWGTCEGFTAELRTRMNQRYPAAVKGAAAWA